MTPPQTHAALVALMAKGCPTYTDNGCNKNRMGCQCCWYCDSNVEQGESHAATCEWLIVEAALAQLPAGEPAARCKWRDAIEDASVVNWTLSSENADDPRKQLADIITQILREHDDPAINGGFVRVRAGQADGEQGSEAQEIKR